jgi:hypothetical protein
MPPAPPAPISPSGNKQKNNHIYFLCVDCK